MPALSERSSSTVLEFRDLHRGFGGVRVLEGIGGRVEPGEVLLVSGPNGSGKSTLLRCLAGLMRPESGTISCRVEGRELDTAARRRAVGYLAPELDFYRQLSARENLDFYGRLRGVERGRGGELLARLGLPGERAAGVFSSGMTQRLRWAWALLARPRILLLDEPFSNLDRPGRDAVRALLEDHLATGLAVVASPDPLELPHVAKHLELGL